LVRIRYMNTAIIEKPRKMTIAPPHGLRAPIAGAGPYRCRSPAVAISQVGAVR
jgi:hypothetical protein